MRAERPAARVELQERDASAAAALFASSVSDTRCTRLERESGLALDLLKSALQEQDESYTRTLSEARGLVLNLQAEVEGLGRASGEASLACERLRAEAHVGARRFQRAEEDVALLRWAPPRFAFA